MDSATPSTPQRLFSGKWVLIVILFVLPGLGIPLLMLGPVTERQVCLITLQTREAHYWSLGSFPLSSKTWELRDEWPELTFPLKDQSLFPPWPEQSPVMHYRLMTQNPEAPLPHLWETTYRELPFALLFPVPNNRALNLRSRPVFELRVLAARTLTPEDSHAFKQLDQLLAEGISQLPTEEIHLRGRQKITAPDDFAGQSNARALQTRFQEALLLQSKDAPPPDLLRKILLQTIEEQISTIDDPLVGGQP